MSSRSAVLNALRSIFRKDFPGRISEDRDSNRSSLYEVPSSDSAVGVPIIVECQAAFAASEIPLAIPKLWLCVHERFLPYLYKR